MTSVDPKPGATHGAAAPSGCRAQDRLTSLHGRPAAAWLEAGRALALQRDLAGAAVVLDAALARYPGDDELCLALAGVRWQQEDVAGARGLLEALLARNPGHVAGALTLARLHIAHGRVALADGVLRALFDRFREPADLVLRAARLLADAACKQGAAALCEAAIAAGTDDPFVRVYAAALQGQLGAFERARAHYLSALDRDPRTIAAGAAYGLASITHYTDPADPDLVRFKAILARADLTADGRASVLFALGKAHDDLAQYVQAATCLRRANHLIDHHGWSRKHWRRMLDARLAGMRWPRREPDADACVPVFVVGAPRSGTTLVAELLGRAADVRNRGELDALPDCADALDRNVSPSVAQLEAAAAAYLAKLQQGARGAHWMIDKQPLNFLHLDLIRALLPQARIVYCRRSPRDTALSIWSQHFESPDYAFAYDFADIAVVLDGSARLLAQARRSDPRLLEVRYEDLVRDPQTVMGTLAAALGLAPFDCTTSGARAGVIGTASVWQARQPVYTRSIGRWRHYASSVPELMHFTDD